MSIESYPSPNGVLTSLIWRKTMSGGEISLSGYDNASQALSYTPGQEQVYLNGILLVRADDYTATNGTSITGLSALSASDFVQVNCYNNFSVASVPAASLTGTVTNAQLANSAITINGSAISLGGTVTLAGDIESVTATSPLTGGGSTGALTVGIQSASTTQSGAVQLSDSTSTTSSILAATPTAVKSAYDLANGAIAKTLTTTTGDIIYASSANTPARLGIGSTGQSLVVASGVPSWATPAGGGMTSLASGAIASGATTLSLTSISGSYNTLELRISKASNSGGAMTMQVNGDTASNYNYLWVDSDAANLTWAPVSTTSIRLLRLGYAGSSTNITFPNYTSTTSSRIIEIRSASDGSARVGVVEGTWYNQAAAISSILVTFAPAIDSAGTYVLYGVK